jgi:4-alpha-glucanotransferase
MLDAELDLAQEGGLRLSDEWLGLAVSLRFSRSGGIWCFPIATVSQSDGGLEGVYQSSCVIPHWHVTADEQGHWDVVIEWGLDHIARHSTVAEERPSRLAQVSLG